MKGELIDVSDAQLCCEVRGAGEPLLLVVGLTGGAGGHRRPASLGMMKGTSRLYAR